MSLGVEQRLTRLSRKQTGCGVSKGGGNQRRVSSIPSRGPRKTFEAGRRRSASRTSVDRAREACGAAGDMERAGDHPATSSAKARAKARCRCKFAPVLSRRLFLSQVSTFSRSLSLHVWRARGLLVGYLPRKKQRKGTPASVRRRFGAASPRRFDIILEGRRHVASSSATRLFRPFGKVSSTIAFRFTCSKIMFE